MSRLSLRLLGPFSVTVDSAPFDGFHSDKARALLACLALECDRPQRREALAGLLWPGYPEHSARASLSQALHSLQQLATPLTAGAPLLITATRTDLQLYTAACDIDVLAFSTLLDEVQRHRHPDGELCDACAAALRQALALYAGELLTGFSLRDSPEFEEWLVMARERFRRLAIAAAQAVAAYAERHGGGEAAIASARRWTELDPLDEQAQRGLIRLLAGAGQRSQALAQYDTYRRMLRAELGIEPEEATRALYERIRTQAGPPLTVPPVIGGDAGLAQGSPLWPAGGRRDPSPQNNLPAPVDSFVGRVRELREVTGLLCDPAVRLVTLVGTGGMGKTRLALEVARACLGDFGAGVWVVDLAPLKAAPLPAVPLAQEPGPNGDEGAVVRAIASVLQVAIEESPDLIARIILALQDRELLLVLDNCEHVLGGVVPALARLLAACPTLTVLATCREPLRTAGEHLYQLAPLDVPSDAGDLDAGDVLRDYSAVQLLAQRASAARYGAVIDGENLGAAISVCRHLDGMPLAIELAAARLNALSMGELADALGASGARQHSDERWSLLSAGSRAARPRQQTLQATVAWSYGLLGEQERRLFERLSAFSGTFDLDAAVAVAASDADGDLAPGEVAALLALLVDCSLVQRVQVQGEGLRYRLLETLRVYALDRLAERGETERVAGRHADYYLRMTESLEPVLRSNTPEAVELLFRLDAERDNLGAAIRWCLAHDRAETAVRIASAAWFWVMYHTHLEEYARYARQALEHEFDLPAVVRAQAWDLVGLYAFNWGRSDEFAAAGQAELRAAREAEDGYRMGWAVGRLGMYARVTGDHARAKTLFRESQAIWRDVGEEDHALMHEILLADYEPPGERLASAERALPATPNACHAYVFQMAGVMGCRDGYLERAEAHWRTAIAGWAGLGNRTMEAAVTSWLGSLRLLRGAGADEVLELAAHSTRMARTAGHGPGYIERQWARGDMLWQLGRLPEALTALEETLAQAVRQGEQGLARGIRESLAQAQAERGDLASARAACDAAAAGVRDGDESARLLHARGRVAALGGDAAEAVRWMRLALDAARGDKSRPEIAMAMEHLAWALAENGEHREAAALLAEAQSEREAMGMVLCPVEVPHHERAVTLAGRRRPERGIT